MYQDRQKLKTLFYEILGELSIFEITTNLKLMRASEKVASSFIGCVQDAGGGLCRN